MFFKLLISGILAAALTFAQGRGGGGGADMGEPGGGGGGRGGGVSMPSLSSRPARLDQIAEALKLNKDQKKEVKSVMDEAQKAASPVRDQLLKSRLAIGEAIQSAKSQEEINQLVGSEAALESQMAGIELNAFVKIYKVLDKDQQAGTRTVFPMMKGVFNGKNWNTED